MWISQDLVRKFVRSHWRILQMLLDRILHFFGSVHCPRYFFRLFRKDMFFQIVACYGCERLADIFKPIYDDCERTEQTVTNLQTVNGWVCLSLVLMISLSLKLKYFRVQEDSHPRFTPCITGVYLANREARARFSCFAITTTDVRIKAGTNEVKNKIRSLKFD